MNFNTITLFLLEVAGLTWANIQKKITDRLPPPTNKALGIATKLVGNPPTISKVENALQEFNKEWDDVAERS